MADTVNVNRNALAEKDLSSVQGGAIPWYTPSQYSLVGNSLAGMIHMIMSAAQPSYDYSDVGANLMSLIMDWGEYYFGYYGKKESDPKAKAIEAVLRSYGVDMIQVRIALEQAIRSGN